VSACLLGRRSIAQFEHDYTVDVRWRLADNKCVRELIVLRTLIAVYRRAQDKTAPMAVVPVVQPFNSNRNQMNIRFVHPSAAAFASSILFDSSITYSGAFSTPFRSFVCR